MLIYSNIECVFFMSGGHHHSESPESDSKNIALTIPNEEVTTHLVI